MERKERQESLLVVNDLINKEASKNQLKLQKSQQKTTAILKDDKQLLDLKNVDQNLNDYPAQKKIIGRMSFNSKR